MGKRIVQHYVVITDDPNVLEGQSFLEGVLIMCVNSLGSFELMIRLDELLTKLRFPRGGGSCRGVYVPEL